MKKLKIILKSAILTAFFVLACQINVNAQAQYPDTARFTASDTWVVPAGVFSVTLEAWGGGGAGGYAKSTTNWLTRSILRPTGGGGGGAYARSIIEVVPGESMNVVVGAKGTTSGNNTENPTVAAGGNSYVQYNNAMQVLAAGGKTVTGVRTTNGAAGGKATDCVYNDVAFSGGNGGNAYTGVLSTGAYCSSGGGGGAAGVSSNGGNGSNGAYYVKGDGGEAGTGNPNSGKGGDGVASTIVSGNWGGNAGDAGKAYGGGGGGSISNAATYALGASGAPGYVRIAYVVTVLDVHDWKDTICSATHFNYTPQDGMDGIVPAGTQYTWTIAYNDGGIVGAEDQTTFVDAITASLTNPSGKLDSVVYNVTAHYESYSTDFTVMVIVYPVSFAGTISKDQLVCQDMVVDQLVNDLDPAGGGLDPVVSWQVSHDNASTWADIADANSVEYTPTSDVLSSITNLIRRVYTTSCGTEYSNVLTLTNPNPLSPGSISVDGDEAGAYCERNVNAILTANATANPVIEDPDFSYQWQESYDQGATWNDIADATDNTYAVALNPLADTVSYRYQVKYDNCSWMVSNNTYDLILKQNIDYTKQFDTVRITLYFGVQDTSFVNLPAPKLTPAPISITPNFDSESRRNAGEYIVNWIVEEDCGILMYDQVVIVEYPVCDNTEDVFDYEGNRYAVVSVGHNCWLAENLRSTKYSDGSDIPFAKAYYTSTYPDSYNNALKFGRLYSWYSAVNVEEGSAAAPTVINGPTGDYIQGACPQGWAVPTQEEYAELWTATGVADNVKASDVTTWLTDKNGIEPGSGLSIPGSGFYNSNIHRYENLLGQAYLWSSTTGAIIQKGVCSVIDHTCPIIVSEEHMKGMGFSIRCIRKE